MREADFEVLLRLVERLSDGQREALGRALVHVQASYCASGGRREQR